MPKSRRKRAVVVFLVANVMAAIAIPRVLQWQMAKLFDVPYNSVERKGISFDARNLVIWSFYTESPIPDGTVMMVGGVGNRELAQGVVEFVSCQWSLLKPEWHITMRGTRTGPPQEPYP